MGKLSCKCIKKPITNVDIQFDVRLSESSKYNQNNYKEITIQLEILIVT